MGLWDKIKHGAETVGQDVQHAGQVAWGRENRGIRNDLNFLGQFLPPSYDEVQRRHEQALLNLRAHTIIQQIMTGQATGPSTASFNPVVPLDTSQIHDRRMEPPNPFTLALIYGLNDRQINHGF